MAFLQSASRDCQRGAARGRRKDTDSEVILSHTLGEVVRHAGHRVNLAKVHTVTVSSSFVAQTCLHPPAILC